jgi:phage shock protein E
MLKGLKRLMKRGDERVIEVIRKGGLLIDVRTSREFEIDGVNGTVNYPLDDLFKEMNFLDKQRPVVVFCRSGNRSRHAKFMLEENGFVQVEDVITADQLRKLLMKAKENGKT